MIRLVVRDGQVYWYEDSPILQDWKSGMSYDDLHTKYGPWGSCECDHCDLLRAKEREEENHEG